MVSETTGAPQPGSNPATPDSATQSGGLPSPSTPARDAALLERALFEVKRVIVGQDRMIERMLVCLLCRGHCLLEGVPGVAKTLAVETLAMVSGGTFARLQFTPDLVPSDIIGTRIYRTGAERFDTELGPVFANFVLTDEINRAPAKVQSALLEVMAEQQVSIGGHTYPMPQPFLVMATQNPIESEGVYPLPEAQRDRFLMKILVDYPTGEEERQIVYRMGVEPPVAEQVLSPADVLRLQRSASRVFVHHALVDYVVRVVLSTRTPGDHGMPDVAGWVSYGASPRASLGMIAAARGLALMRGRDYVLPQDVLDIAPDILRHRLVLSYDALADGVPADQIVHRVLQTVPLPQVTPRQRAAGGPYSGAYAAGGVAPPLPTPPGGVPATPAGGMPATPPGGVPRTPPGSAGAPRPGEGGPGDALGRERPA
jgi:MoxR-like ATPase